MKSKKLISIIILNWNGINETRECLKSLLKVIDVNININIIVIDNGSKNNEASKIKKEFNKVIVLPLKENKGFSGGVNYGIIYAQETFNPDYYLLLNNDTEVEKDFLVKLVEKLEKSKSSLANPLILDYYDHNKIWYGGGKINWILAKPYHLTDKNIINQEYEFQEYLTGCALLIKKDVIEKIGILDDRFFAYFEDAAYSLSAKQANFKCIIVPNSRIYHIQAASTGKKSKMNTYLVSRNRVLFVKHYGLLILQPYFYLFLTLKMFFALIYFTLTNQQERRYAYHKGFIDGIFGNGGIPTL